MDSDWNKKFRILTFSLIFSGALNIGFLVQFAIFQFCEKGTSIGNILEAENGREIQFSNLALLHAYSKYSFRELVSLLTNREIVEEGYAKRDLALSSLVAFYYFNLEKAIGSQPVQKRFFSMDSEKSIELYPGLTDDQFDAAVRFAYQEKYPMTTQGLFFLLQKKPEEEALQQAFMVTPEFFALQQLFQKTSPQDPSILVSLIREGSWELLDHFVKEQMQILDVSVEKRRRLLLSYLTHQSKTAAYLLLKTDLLFIKQKLEDSGVCNLLSLLSYKTEEAEKFCISLLQSPRSDLIWRLAAEKLYAFAEEPMPSVFDIQLALQRFSPQTKSIIQEKKAISFNRHHVVAEGESLWKIARAYKVKVDDLIQMNGIENDRLYPGMTLKIPD